jgi:ATP-dependent Lon protease
MMKKAGTINPICLLDEVDKMSMDFRGDPSAALLEVLDPEQNHMFMDHYLDVEYDLSKVFFITTANVTHTVPQPLQDRMEILRLSGYTEPEKLEIAKRFLVRKQREAAGLTPENLGLTDEAILEIIGGYTREAGVRNLEREIANICRKVARKVVADGKKLQVAVTPGDLQEYLGVIKFRDTKSEEKSGQILNIEATIMEGRGKLLLTGMLGDVMQESGQAAMSYVRSRAAHWGLEPGFYRHLDIHIHIPEGSIPKDGPSAGITLATAVVSALTKIPVQREVAMTGEITLRGKILPIGGVKEKLLAAHRAGARVVLLPRDNEKDLSEIPANIQQELVIHFVESMDEVLDFALERKLERQPVRAPGGEQAPELEPPALGAEQKGLAN